MIGASVHDQVAPSAEPLDKGASALLDDAKSSALMRVTLQAVTRSQLFGLLRYVVDVVIGMGHAVALHAIRWMGRRFEGKPTQNDC